MYNGDDSQRKNLYFVYNYWYCSVDALPDTVAHKEHACRYFPKNKSGVAAVTYRYYGTITSNYYTLFCPFFLGGVRDAPVYLAR